MEFASISFAQEFMHVIYIHSTPVKVSDISFENSSSFF